jgi:hypothetical protein
MSQKDVKATLRGDSWRCNVVLRARKARAVSPEVSSRSGFRTLQGCKNEHVGLAPNGRRFDVRSSNLSGCTTIFIYTGYIRVQIPGAQPPLHFRPHSLLPSHAFYPRFFRSRDVTIEFRAPGR